MFMRTFHRRSLALPGILLLWAVFPAALQAHPGHGLEAAPAAALEHAFQGIDHVALMLAIGIAAAGLGRSAIGLLPAGFVAASAIGLLTTSSFWLVGGVSVVLMSLALVAFALSRSSRSGVTLWVLPLTVLIGGLHGASHAGAFAHQSAAAFFGFLAGNVLLALWGISLGLCLKGQRVSASCVRDFGKEISVGK